VADEPLEDEVAEVADVADLTDDEVVSDELEAEAVLDAGDELELASDEDAFDAGAPLTPDEIAALIAAGEELAPPTTAPAPVPPLPVATPRVEEVQLPDLPQVLAPMGEVAGIDLLMDVPLQITVELGQATRTIRELLEIGHGSLLHLSRHAGEPVDVLVNGQPIAKGEVVVIDENFGIRVTEVVSPADRLRTMAA
jgi:flagellar motor switch protein FliN/FliY